MGQSVRSVLQLLAFGGLLIAVLLLVFGERRGPERTIMLFAAIVSGVSFCGLWWLNRRRDVYPDLLRNVAPRYFNLKGCCFAFSSYARDGLAWVRLNFQNQYEGTFEAHISIRPMPGFWLQRADVGDVRFGIECPGGSVGWAELAIQVPESIAGKSIAFEVGAAVTYPAGRGRRVRFADGESVRCDHWFASGSRWVLVILSIFTGHFTMSRPTQVILPMPRDVPSSLPERPLQRVHIEWMPDDIEASA